jgi:outer membrane biosynthesis protein TonB
VPEIALLLVVDALAAGAALWAVEFADVVDGVEFVVEVVVLLEVVELFFFFLVVEVVVAAVAAGAGVAAAGAVVAEAALEEPESDEPESDEPESEPPEASPPAFPNCGGVIERTAPSPPMVPPTMSAKRLDSMEFKLLGMYS